MYQSIARVIGLGLFIAVIKSVAPLAAQETGVSPEFFEEIVVTAPRMEVQERRLPMGRGSGVSMSYAVSFADLDLNSGTDRTELEERVTVAANEICEALFERYPGSQTDPRQCTRQAINNAMAQIRSAIDAAGESD